MIDIFESLITLAQHRPIFHSEADFQHALAWQIHQQLPRSQVRLELPFRRDSGTTHLDLWISSSEGALAIEVKYKTRGLSLVMDQEQYKLADQSAQDGGRYDFVKDIQRLEQMTMTRPDITGYAVLLTNDSSYWVSSHRSFTVDSAFRLHQGRTLSGLLEWGTGASIGTTRGRELGIRLQNKYQIDWGSYSKIQALKYNEFRFIAVKVTCANRISKE